MPARIRASMVLSVSFFTSFFDEAKKALRRKGDEPGALEIPVNVTVLRDNKIDLHEIGKGCYQRIRVLHSLLLSIFLKGRLGDLIQIVILNLLRRPDQSEEILFKLWGKIPLHLPENNLRNKETEFF
jgi:hypothetical protein